MKLKQGKKFSISKRARQKELKNANNKQENLEKLKPIKRDINISETITVRN